MDRLSKARQAAENRAAAKDGLLTDVESEQLAHARLQNRLASHKAKVEALSLILASLTNTFVSLASLQASTGLVEDQNVSSNAC